MAEFAEEKKKYMIDKETELRTAEKNSKLEIAKKLKQKGMNISEIKEITGLNEEEIKNMKV